jgi:hypothetical protein
MTGRGNRVDAVLVDVSSRLHRRIETCECRPLTPPSSSMTPKSASDAGL